ncbi:hypothetical protein MiTs_03877 [Microcystis aeruginosa NIES-2521]|uniref:Uncharacterized protein n=2 Tax=Microcystis aeruginosa TaxID=1126 RepID=A0A5A5S3H2_MICAE|nr:hypothetical protein MiTs_03877 [Microcystis aeruginosa NIES-2521]
MKPKYTALSAYSVLLEIMVETGIIGFTCFLWSPLRVHLPPASTKPVNFLLGKWRILWLKNMGE